MRCKNCAHRIYSDNKEGMWSHQRGMEEERCFEPSPEEVGLCDCSNPEPQIRHSKYCDGVICNGKVSCPTTGKKECGKELNFIFYPNGKGEVFSVVCFGCNKQHGVKP